MPTPSASLKSSAPNPLALIEHLMSTRKWPFKRRSDEEMIAEILGRWCDYNLYFTWHEGACAMHFSCALDIRVRRDEREAVHELLAKVNEKLWIGHFGLWEEEGPPMFCHTLPLRGTDGATLEQVEDLVDVAINECERFYPAFRFVVGGGKSPDEAVKAAILEIHGEA